MGHIKEPIGVDLNLDPMPLTAEDLQFVSSLISEYKQTKQVPCSKPKLVKATTTKKTLVVSSQKRKMSTNKNVANTK